MNVGAGPDSLQVLHTGAVLAGAVQDGADASLGGPWAGSRAQSYSVLRPAAVPGFAVEFVSGNCGDGLARIESNGEGSFRYAAPGDTFGDYEAVALDARGVLPSGDAEKYAIIHRTASVVRAVESMQLRPTVNAVAGTSDFTEAESTAGAYHHRAVVFRNAGSTEITNVKAWVSGVAAGGTAAIGPDTTWQTPEIAGSVVTFSPIEASGDDYWQLTDTNEATFDVTAIPTGSDLIVAAEFAVNSFLAYDLSVSPQAGSVLAGDVTLTGAAVLSIYGLPPGDKNTILTSEYVLLDTIDASGAFSYTFTSGGYGSLIFHAAIPSVSVPFDGGDETIINAAGVMLSDVTLTNDAISGIEIAEDTLDGDGAVQAIATETDAPASVTFSAPQNIASAIELGPLAAGAAKALWIRRSVGVGASANAANEARVLYDGDGVAGSILGINRIAAADTAAYCLLVSSDGPPDETYIIAESATLPVTFEYDLPANTYYVETRRRNRFGILGAAIRTDVIVVDAEGEVVANPPSAPILYNLQRSPTAGAVVVSASYQPAADELAGSGIRATHWAIWLAVGTDPDTGTEATAEVAMKSIIGSGIEQLFWTSAVQAEGADVRVIVRARRKVEVPDEDPEEPSTWLLYDSANVNVLQITASAVGPTRPVGSAFLGRQFGVAVPPIAVVATVIDEDANVYLETGPDYAAFYADTVLIWRVVHSSLGHPVSTVYIPATWSLVADAVTGTNEAGITVDPTWPTAKKIYISAGTDDDPTADNVVVIDVDALTITSPDFTFDAVTAGASTLPVLAEAAQTSLYAPNPTNDTMVAYAAALSTAVFKIAFAAEIG